MQDSVSDNQAVGSVKGNGQTLQLCRHTRGYHRMEGPAMHSQWQEQNDMGGSRLALSVKKGHPMFPQHWVLGLSPAAK